MTVIFLCSPNLQKLQTLLDAGADFVHTNSKFGTTNKITYAKKWTFHSCHSLYVHVFWSHFMNEAFELMGAELLWNLFVPSAWMISIQMCKLPIPWALMYPHTIRELKAQTFNWVLITSWILRMFWVYYVRIRFSNSAVFHCSKFQDVIWLQVTVFSFFLRSSSFRIALFKLKVLFTLHYEIQRTISIIGENTRKYFEHRWSVQGRRSSRGKMLPCWGFNC